MSDDYCDVDEELLEKSNNDITDVLRKALDERYPSHAPHMVVNWVLVGNIIESRGEHVIWTTAPVVLGHSWYDALGYSA